MALRWQTCGDGKQLAMCLAQLCCRCAFRYFLLLLLLLLVLLLLMILLLLQRVGDYRSGGDLFLLPLRDPTCFDIKNDAHWAQLQATNTKTVFIQVEPSYAFLDSGKCSSNNKQTHTRTYTRTHTSKGKSIHLHVYIQMILPKRTCVKAIVCLCCVYACVA